MAHGSCLALPVVTGLRRQVNSMTPCPPRSNTPNVTSCVQDRFEHYELPAAITQLSPSMTENPSNLKYWTNSKFQLSRKSNLKGVVKATHTPATCSREILVMQLYSKLQLAYILEEYWLFLCYIYFQEPYLHGRHRL